MSAGYLSSFDLNVVQIGLNINLHQKYQQRLHQNTIRKIVSLTKINTVSEDYDSLFCYCCCKRNLILICEYTISNIYQDTTHIMLGLIYQANVLLSVREQQANAMQKNKFLLTLSMLTFFVIHQGRTKILQEGFKHIIYMKQQIYYYF